MYFPSPFVPRFIVRQARPVVVEGEPDDRRHPVLRALISGLVCSGLIISPCGGLDSAPLPPVSSVVAGASVLPEKVRSGEFAMEQAGRSAGPVATFWSPMEGDLEPGPADFGRFWEPDFDSRAGRRLLAREDDPVAGPPAAGDPVGEELPATTEEDADGPRPPAEGGPWEPGIAPPTEEDMPDDPPPAGGAGATGGAPAGRELLPIEQEFGEGVIEGEVYDQATLDPIPQAVVRVVGSGREDETDAGGRFRITGLPAGDFTVEAFKLNYSTATASASPRAGSPVTLRFGLKVKPSSGGDEEYVLEEVAVVGEYSGDSQGDFNLDLNVSPTLRSGISEEDFAKQAVSDAGEALEKVSGANVVDGAFAVVRGLADRYVDTTFNSGAISSAVPSRKAVRLDLFPTSTLSAIIVDKLHRPYLTGDFGGAAIDIRTRAFPEEPVINFGVKMEFNPSLPDQILLPADAELDYFGGLGGTAIPQSEITDEDGFLEGGVFSPAAGDPADAEAARVAWETLFNTRQLLPVLRDTRPEESFAASLGNTWEIIDGIEFGLLVAGGAKTEDEYNDSPIVRANGNTWYQEDFRRQQEWNLYAAGGIRAGEDQEITGIYFRKNITQHNVAHASDIIGGAYGDPGTTQGTRPFYGADAYNTGNFYEIDPVEQDLEIFQLSGRHQFGDRGPSVNWTLTESDAIEDRPNYSLFRWTTLDFAAEEQFDEAREIADQRFYEEIQTVFPGAPEFMSLAEAGAFLINQGLPPTAVAGLIQNVQNQYPVVDPSLGRIDTLPINAFTGDAGQGNSSPRTIQSITENTVDQKISIDLPYYFDDDNEDNGVRFGFGFAQNEKTREARGAIYELVPEFLDAAGNNSQGLPEDVLVDMGSDFVANPALLRDLLTGYLAGSPYYGDDTLGGILNLINNVDGFHDISAHYFSGELFRDNFFLRGGVRFESETRSADILPPRPDLPPALLSPPPIDEEEILPSVAGGLTCFDDKVSFIAGWSRTAARPTFYEWLPTRSLDLSTGVVRLGNPGLKNASVTSYDLGAVWSVTDTSSLTLNFFNKEIVDPIIEERRDPNTIGYSNGDLGQLSGAEFECSLQDVGPFSLVANVTYISAELTYTVESPATGGFETTVERFPYQPEWIFNLNLGYEHEDWGLGVNLIYNFTGEYNTILRRVSTDSNLQQQSIHAIDLVCRKSFGDPDDGVEWELTAGIKNLLATDRELVWRGGALDGRTNQVFEAQRTYFVGAKCSF